MMDVFEPAAVGPSVDKLRHIKRVACSKLRIHHGSPSRLLSSEYCTWSLWECIEHAEWLGDIKEYRRAILLSDYALDLAHDDLSTRSRIYKKRALFWLSLNDYQQALQDIDNSVTRTLFFSKSKSETAYNIKSRALVGLSRVEEGVQELVNGLGAYPDNSELKNLQDGLLKLGLAEVVKSRFGEKKLVSNFC